MLIEQTIQKLRSLRLTGMLEGLEEQLGSSEAGSLSFEERIGLLVDRQWHWKENKALQNRMRKANFKTQGCVEDIDYHARRGLTKGTLAQLSLSNWIEHHQNCTISGPTGVGKTYLACAIGNMACRNGFSVYYYTARKLFREIEIATEQGKIALLFKSLSKVPLLIIDDWGMDPLKDKQYRDFLEILDDRYQTGSTLITSQFPIKEWHDTVGNPTLADAILDRIIHNNHKVELDGPSMRKVKSHKERTLNKNVAKAPKK